MEKRKARLTGSQQRVAERSAAPTPSTRLWSWRRSFSSTCTWHGSAVWRSAAVCTSLTGKSKSGSKTGGWNWKRWAGRIGSESSPATSVSHETVRVFGALLHPWQGRVCKAPPPNCENVKKDPTANLLIVVLSYFHVCFLFVLFFCRGHVFIDGYICNFDPLCLKCSECDHNVSELQACTYCVSNLSEPLEFACWTNPWDTCVTVTCRTLCDS